MLERSYVEFHARALAVDHGWKGWRAFGCLFEQLLWFHNNAQFCLIFIRKSRTR
jgi:hypothetical protein